MSFVNLQCVKYVNVKDQLLYNFLEFYIFLVNGYFFLKFNSSIAIKYILCPIVSLFQIQNSKAYNYKRARKFYIPNAINSFYCRSLWLHHTSGICAK